MTNRPAEKSARNWQLILSRSTKFLSDAGFSSANTDARWLLAQALETTPDRLVLVLKDKVEVVKLAQYDSFLQRRYNNEPVSQIIGYRDFYGRRFQINKNVLDPRPETELLVETALEHSAQTVLDIGTGSGCILLSVLTENPQATGLGIDISPQALEVAEKNCELLKLEQRAHFFVSDWFSEIQGSFDQILSNPPYINANDYKNLDIGLRKYEPEIALTTGGDGLDAYRIISRDVMKHLNPGGQLAVEVGHDQGNEVIELFKTIGLEKLKIRNDLDCRNRVVMGYKPSN